MFSPHRIRKSWIGRITGTMMVGALVVSSVCWDINNAILTRSAGNTESGGWSQLASDDKDREPALSAANIETCRICHGSSHAPALVSGPLNFKLQVARFFPENSGTRRHQDFVLPPPFHPPRHTA